MEDEKPVFQHVRPRDAKRWKCAWKTQLFGSPGRPTQASCLVPTFGASPQDLAPLTRGDFHGPIVF